MDYLVCWQLEALLEWHFFVTQKEMEEGTTYWISFVSLSASFYRQYGADC